MNCYDLAKLTPGFSGADIKCLVNDSVLETVDKGLPEINSKEIEHVMDRFTLGIKMKHPFKVDKQQTQAAYHQAGHCLVCYINPVCRKNLFKCSLEAYGESKKGETLTLEDDEINYDREYLLAQVDMALAGVLAESTVFGRSKVTDGCGRDLNQAGKLVDNIVKKFGMSEKWGLSVITDGKKEHKISGSTRNEVDSSCQEMLKESEERVKEILYQHSQILVKNADKIIIKKTHSDQELS